MEEGEKEYLDKDRELVNDGISEDRSVPTEFLTAKLRLQNFWRQKCAYRISDSKSAPTLLKIYDLHNLKGW